MTDTPPSVGKSDARHDTSLGLFYQHVNTEIAALREAEFRTGLLSLALNAAIIATIAQDRVAAELTTPVRCIITVVSTIVVLVLISYLFQIHSFLAEHRSMRRRIEHHFDLDRPGVIGDVPLLPSRWRNQPTVPFSFQAWGVVIPLILLMVAFQSCTLYLLWSL